ncbi:MAG: LVIVD repeat-containing protein, partial [Candidatus Heimdallarchaeaceae archaeon]
MNIKIKKGKGAIIGLTLLFSMISFIDFHTTIVDSETFDPFLETFTTTDYMDVSNTNVSGWGTGSIYNTNRNPEFIGSIGSPFIDPPTEVYVHGDHAILGVSGSTNTLETIDISDITNPLVNDSIVVSSNVVSICVENNYAYLALYGKGLQIVNITNPSNLANLGYYDTAALVLSHDVEVSGEYVFLAVEYTPTYFGIQVLDISNPNTIIGSPGWTYETNGTINDIEIKNSFAYIGNSSSMLVLNITNPLDPLLYSEFTGLNNVNDIFIYGNYAFIADESGLVVLNITNPLTPTLAGEYAFSDIRQVIVDGTFAYVVDEYGDVFVLDVSDLDNIEQISMYDYPGVTEAASSIYLHGSHLYVAALALGMDILEVSNNIQPTREEHFPLTPGVDRAITIVGDLAYVVGNYFGGGKFHGTLRIYDISDPTNAVLLKNFDLAPGILNFGHIFYDIEIYGNIAYVM